MELSEKLIRASNDFADTDRKTSLLLYHAGEAIREAGNGQEWKPIETAPKDGVFIVLYCPNGIADRNYSIEDAPFITIGSHDASFMQSRQWLSVETVTYVTDYGGQTGVCEDTTRLQIEPTHWMPLPSPPIGE